MNRRDALQRLGLNLAVLAVAPKIAHATLDDAVRSGA